MWHKMRLKKRAILLIVMMLFSSMGTLLNRQWMGGPAVSSTHASVLASGRQPIFSQVKAAHAAMQNTAIQYGDLVDGTIGQAAQIDTYTFTAAAGDIVQLGLGDDSSIFYPQLRILVDGQFVEDQSSTGNYLEVTYTVTTSGSHTILVSDDRGVYTADYSLSLHKLNPPTSSTLLSYGNLDTGSILSRTEMAFYRFSANANDLVLLALADDSSIFYPELRLLDSAGNVIMSQSSNGNYVELQQTITEAGMYTVIVTDQRGSYTAGYALGMYKLNPPINSIPLINQIVQAGSISKSAEMDIFSITVESNSSGLINLSDNSSIFYPEVRIFNAAGDELNRQNNNGNNLEFTHTFTATGTYYLLVRDNRGVYTADYTLSFTCLTNNCFPEPADPPSVSIVAPNFGYNDVVNEISIEGSDFAEGAVVTLGEQPLTTTFVDVQTLIAIVPEGIAAGVYDIVITNPDGQTGQLSNGYTLLEKQAAQEDLFSFDHLLYTTPQFPRANSTADLALLVHRIGGKQTLSNVAVDFYVGDPAAGGTLIGRGIIPLLSPNDAASTTAVSWTPSEVGSQTLYAVIDPDQTVAEFDETNNGMSRPITILTAEADTVAPRVDSFFINDNAPLTTLRTVSLDTTVDDPSPSSGIDELLFIEYSYVPSVGVWLPLTVSPWLDYETARQDHPWEIQPRPGLKYIQAWAKDKANNVSLFPGNDFIGYLPGVDRIAATQTRVYRFYVEAGQVVQATVEPLNGDPDLYIWPPAGSQRSPWWSVNETGDDAQSFTAPESGVYQFEVYGYTAAEFHFSVSIEDAPVYQAAADTAVTNRVINKHQMEKDIRDQPAVALDSQPGNTLALPAPQLIPPVESTTSIYLPLIMR